LKSQDVAIFHPKLVANQCSYNMDFHAGWFWLYFRLFAINAITNQYVLLIRQEASNNKRNKAIEKC